MGPRARLAAVAVARHGGMPGRPSAAAGACTATGPSVAAPSWRVDRSTRPTCHLSQALFDLEATNAELKGDLRDLWISGAQVCLFVGAANADVQRSLQVLPWCAGSSRRAQEARAASEGKCGAMAAHALRAHSHSRAACSLVCFFSLLLRRRSTSPPPARPS